MWVFILDCSYEIERRLAANADFWVAAAAAAFAWRERPVLVARTAHVTSRRPRGGVPRNFGPRPRERSRFDSIAGPTVGGKWNSYWT